MLISIGPAWAAERSTPSRDAGASGQNQFTPVVSDMFTPVDIGRVKLTGLLGKHVDSVPGRLMKGQREAYLQPFENPADTNSWRAEHIGKWLETACNRMVYSQDANLRAAVDDVVNRLIKLQQPDGWLGSYAPDYRFHTYDWRKNVDKKYEPFYDGPFYDVWCHYLTMGGLIRYYETTGDPRALEASQKIAKLFLETFGEGKQDLMLINHDHGFGPGVGVLPISKLYLLTGDIRYRDFCRYIVAQYGRKGKVPIMIAGTTDAQYPFPDWAQIKHCEFELCLAGMYQLYRGTGDQPLFATCRNLYEGYFAPLTETISLHGFKNPPPGMRVPDTYYGFLETCDIVPMLRWFVEMARITGDSQYLDALEWNLYNSLLSRDLPDGRVWPGVDVPKDDFFHCCYSMLSVGLSYIPNWVYFTTTNGIMVNLYESSVLSTRLAGVDVKLKQTTAFPLEGTVTLTIEPERPASFDLLLRVPKWCQNARAFVNGKPLAGDRPAPGAFLKLSRQWEGSNTVTLVLDMPARAVPREFARSAGKPVVTFERGPLLLAMTAKLNPGLDLKKTSPSIESDNTLRVETMGELKPSSTSSISFRANGMTTVTQLGEDTLKPTLILLVPYAYSGVSDKPVPPPKEGVFNVYSEDGVGAQVRVEFPPTQDSKSAKTVLRIPRVSTPWKEALRLVGDGKTLYSDFTLIKDKVERWHCIGTFGKGGNEPGNGYAVSDGYTLFHAVGNSLEAPMTHLDKISYQIQSPQAFMWAPGAVWNKERTTAFLYYFHFFGSGKTPEKSCTRLLTSDVPDLGNWRPYGGTELPEKNMVFNELENRDYCVFWDERLRSYLIYYCASGAYRNYPGVHGRVRARTSKDLVHWSDPVTVMGPPPNDQHGYSESPFVLYRDGFYYLWVSGIDYSHTHLYISEDPFDFGDAIANSIEETPGHAPELVSDHGRDYVTCSMVSTVPSATPAAHDLDGILIQPVRWDKPDPGMEARVTRKR